MVDIGSTLREARRRRGLTLADVESSIRIRSKYLAALEGDRFDDLPGAAYARAFLREYARHLGLDEEILMEELSIRHPAAEEPLVPSGRGFGRPRRRFSGSLLLVLLAILAIGALGVVAWQFGSREPSAPGELEGRASPPPASAESPPATTRTSAEAAAPTARSEERRPRTWTLVLRATFGDCWLTARFRSRSGEVLYEGLLRRGQSLRFGKRPLWIRLGAPQNLTATLNGSPVEDLPRDTANILVTRTGIRTLSD